MRIAAPLLLLLLAACGSSSSDTPTTDDSNEQTSSFTFTCTEDKTREDKWAEPRFASLKLELKGKTAKLTDVVYTASYVAEMNQGLANEKAYLAKGLDYDGKTPLTAEDRSQASSYIDQLEKILAANGTLAFTGDVKPYVRKPKKPTIQYPLVPTTGALSADSLWNTLGNEGNGARLLLPPDMATGKPGKPDIEFEGSQGPMWDRYDCK